MRSGRIWQVQQVEGISLFEKVQSFIEKPCYLDKAYKGVLVAACKAKPEFMIFLHFACGKESCQVQASLATFVDQDLARVQLPVIWFTLLAQHAPDRIGGSLHQSSVSGQRSRI